MFSLPCFAWHIGLRTTTPCYFQIIEDMLNVLVWPIIPQMLHSDGHLHAFNCRFCGWDKPAWEESTDCEDGLPATKAGNVDCKDGLPVTKAGNGGATGRG